MASAAAAKKWPRLFQCWALLRIHQPEVGLVDQRRGLERLAGLLLGHLCGGQLAQLVVDQRQELLGGVRVALLDGGQDARHLAHRTGLGACGMSTSLSGVTAARRKTGRGGVQ